MIDYNISSWRWKTSNLDDESVIDAEDQQTRDLIGAKRNGLPNKNPIRKILSLYSCHDKQEERVYENPKLRLWSLDA